MDNNKYNFSVPSFECLLAAGPLKTLEAPAGEVFYLLQQFKQENNDWLFGHLSYDLKNEIENLFSANIDEVKFPDIFFFVPQVLLLLNDNELKIGVIDLDASKIFDAIFFFAKKYYTR